MQTLLLVDGHNFLFKSFAVPFTFNSSKGTPLHVATVFTSLLRRLIMLSKYNYPNLLVVFDAKGPNTNSMLFSDYKKNRKDDYSQEADSPFLHLPTIKGMLDYLSINWIEKDGFEADDLIATAATRFCDEHSSNVAYIASSDSDFYQLVGPRINQVLLKSKGAHTIIDENWVRNKYGISPSEYAELKSWVGDKADNISGIDGIGWIRAAEIVNGKRTRALTVEEEQKLALNRKLITLRRDIQFQFSYSYPRELTELSNPEIFRRMDL